MSRIRPLRLPSYPFVSHPLPANDKLVSRASAVAIELCPPPQSPSTQINMLRSIARRSLVPLARSYPLSAQQTSISTSSLWRLFGTENKPTPDQQTGSTDAAPGGDAQTAAKDEATQGDAELSEVEQLQKQLEEKDAQILELNDRSLRTLAEMENVRMIARRDVDNTRKYAAVPFAKSILGVADNLGLALGSVDEEKLEAADTDPMMKGLFVGIQATESELLKVFSKHGISRYGSVGDKFDPNRYQAMFEAPSAEHEPGTVISVQKVGYEMEERVLRPAEVGVSKAP